MDAGSVLAGIVAEEDVGGYNIIAVECRGGAMGEDGLLVGGGEVDEGRS